MRSDKPRPNRAVLKAVREAMPTPGDSVSQAEAQTIVSVARTQFEKAKDPAKAAPSILAALERAVPYVAPNSNGAELFEVLGAELREATRTSEAPAGAAESGAPDLFVWPEGHALADVGQLLNFARAELMAEGPFEVKTPRSIEWTGPERRVGTSDVDFPEFLNAASLAYYREPPNEWDALTMVSMAIFQTGIEQGRRAIDGGRIGNTTRESAAQLRQATQTDDVALAISAIRAIERERARMGPEVLAETPTAPLTQARGRLLWPEGNAPGDRGDLLPVLAQALEQATSLGGPRATRAAERLFDLGMEQGRRAKLNALDRSMNLEREVRALELGLGTRGLSLLADVLEIDAR